MINEKEFANTVDSFLDELSEGIWNETSYHNIQSFILKESQDVTSDISLEKARIYYILGTGICQFFTCSINPNDVYSIKNLSADDFRDKYEIFLILMNVRFGTCSYDGCKRYFS